MINFIQTLLTEADNQSYCFVRISALVSIIMLFSLEIYSIVVLKQQFNFETVAGSLAALYTGVGVALKLKGT